MYLAVGMLSGMDVISPFSKLRQGLRPGLRQVYYKNSEAFGGKRVNIGHCDTFLSRLTCACMP